ncbi:PTS system mannose/fructose/sorbose family transporter subunit IID [Enterococcus hulanensis]|nr:PTS system mannose/fructose/sorbose family transporter subunit IID [Enterococcus hulanensis]
MENSLNKNNPSNRTVSKKTLDKTWWTWFKYCLGVFGFERLEAPGFAMSMIPLFKELYKDDKEKQVEGVKRHTTFFNTHPYLGGLITGIVASMEIEKANGADVSDEMIENLKVGMMGPVAGIGDSLFQATLYPIVFSVAIGLSTNGSPLGAIFAVLTVFILQLFVTRFVFYQGLKLGQ